MSEENTSKETAAPATQGGSKRLPILLGVLVLGLVGLAYDRAVARPAVDDAYTKIAKRSEEVNADSTATLNNLDVRKLIEREPAEMFTDTNGDWVEKFSWRAGMPIKTHDLFVVFKERDGNFLFHRASKYEFESGGEVSKYDAGTPLVVDMDGADEMEDEDYESGGGGQAGPGGGGAGGGGGRPGGGGGGRNFDPAAMFAERDADGDGLLKGDEISERMSENLSEIDTDGDGAISQEEMTARFEAMRAQFGGGGGGGGGRPNRPELEEEETTESTDATEVTEAPLADE